MEMPPNWRLVDYDRSATGRIAPTCLMKFSVFNYRRHRWIAAVEIEHLALTALVILRVVLDERDVVLVVIIPSSLAIRTVRFYIHYYRHGTSLSHPFDSPKS